MTTQRIGLLYLKTGGGHISAANALASRAKELFGDRVALIPFDPIPRKNYLTKFLLQEGYRISSLKIEKFWIFLYEINKIKFLQMALSAIMIRLVKKELSAFVREKNIQKIAVLHFLLITPTVRIVRSIKKDIPVVTIITDPFTVHSFWFQQPSIPKIVFSEKAREDGIRFHKISGKNLFYFPIILKKQFDLINSPVKIRGMKEKYGFTKGKKLVLFAGGGEGYPKGASFVKALLKRDPDVEIAIVCGRDVYLKRRIENIAKNYPDKKIIAFGFVDFMFDLMNIADIVVSKGGPATIMEALILKKPLIVTQYIYGQEKGNVQFLIDHQVGYYVEKAKEMVQIILNLTSDPDSYNHIKKNLSLLDFQSGTDPIIDFLLSFSSK